MLPGGSGQHQNINAPRGTSGKGLLYGTNHDTVWYVDKGDTIDVKLLGFVNAFNKVPHKLLLQKLSNIPNVSTQIVKLIHYFLMDRKQKVRIKGQFPYGLPVTSGVLQGLVLGPTPFLVYINDLSDHVDCSISLFADDTFIYQVVSNAQDKSRF